MTNAGTMALRMEHDLVRGRHCAPQSRAGDIAVTPVHVQENPEVILRGREIIIHKGNYVRVVCPEKLWIRSIHVYVKQPLEFELLQCERQSSTPSKASTSDSG